MRPTIVSGRSSSSRYRSNFAAPVSTSRWPASQPPGTGARGASSEKATWKSGLRPASRSASSSLTSVSNGTSSWAIASSVSSRTRVSSSLNEGSPPTSARSGTGLAKKPSNRSISGRGRPALTVPSARSLWPV